MRGKHEHSKALFNSAAAAAARAKELSFFSCTAMAVMILYTIYRSLTAICLMHCVHETQLQLTLHFSSWSK